MLSAINFCSRKLYMTAICFLAFSASTWTAVSAEEETHFVDIKPQFIAALGNPSASSGTGAETWGIWRKDPGPRGVWLRLFPVLKATGGYAHAGWVFDEKDWWLDENGLIMEKPDFPMPAGRYMVTGERETTAMLTVHKPDENGEMRWELNKNAVLHDVTHMPCRSARYTPAGEGKMCSPSNAPMSKFKVPPGSVMPDIEGCNRQDYQVLIVVAVEVPKPASTN